MHHSNFASVVMCMVFVCFYAMYTPEYFMKDEYDRSMSMPNIDFSLTEDFFLSKGKT